MAQSFLQTEFVGLTKYLNCAKIFFIHKEQIPNEWIQRLGFQVQKIYRSGPISSLAFVLIYQPSKSNVDVSRLQKISPEPISAIHEPSKTHNKTQIRETSQSIDSTRGHQFNRQQSGPRTPDILSNYEPQQLSRNPSQSLGDQEPRSFKPPTFNIRDEFMDMDTDAQNLHHQGNSRGSQSRDNSRRSWQPANEQQRAADVMQEEGQEMYNEDLYEEEMRYGQGPQPRHNQPTHFGRSREQSQDSRSFSNQERRQPNKWQNQEQYPRYPENNRQRAPVERNFAPTRAAQGNQPNPFYLEYLKSKSSSQALSSSPIAQKFLSRSPNPSYDTRTTANSNFQRTNYPSRDVSKGEYGRRPNFTQSYKAQSYGNQQYKPENERRGGFVYSNQMSTNRHQKPFNPQKNMW